VAEAVRHRRSAPPREEAAFLANAMPGLVGVGRDTVQDATIASIDNGTRPRCDGNS
jgi:hypothetical protein